MEESRRRMIFLPLFICAMALFFFFRTPGAESVRWVQILLLFVSGACAGVALAHSLQRVRDR